MIIKNATFVTSAARAEQFLACEKPMIAVCGKSNVGKSSLINMLANRKNLAKTSATPGRTRLVNYFDFGQFMLADLPGYGYAAVSKAEKDKWAVTLQKFFERSQELTHVFVLIDIRHGATEDDVAMMELLNYYIVPFTVVLTKADKLSRMRAKEHAKKIADSIGLTRLNVLVVSSQTREGKEELLDRIESALAVRSEQEDIASVQTQETREENIQKSEGDL